ncbi:MAG: hypothetical protein CVU13_10145 [Bacteroidetes bacterium HGW-Bacteroidetes-8]|jgi:glycosyltransferase involved in cell wall biosynthesis|nr:MAG: hypothetical protein CVU13_10145 [Bacteroidetes bacterium HGW-Bacteroidetes-8]
MANILINGYKANTGGGKMILDNFANHLDHLILDHVYYILTPASNNYPKNQNKNIIIVDLPEWCKKNYLFPLLYYYQFPKLLRTFKIDLIFNFGDIIIPSKIKQIYFFDWAYAVYNDDYIWSKIPFFNKITRKAKVFLIRKYIGKVCLVLAQTKSIENRLVDFFKIKNTTVIPTPLGISPEKCLNGIQIENNSLKLFYPASYSPHKNHQILLEVAKKIISRKLNITIFITINNNDFLATIEKNNLSSVLVNLGTLDKRQMNCLYNDCDGVIFPTLLETYGLPFYEAMAYEKPIFTSNLDFAKDACEDFAIYFNPFDAEDIINKITNNIYSKDQILFMTNTGLIKFKKLPSWPEVITEYNQCINLVLSNNYN